MTPSEKNGDRRGIEKMREERRRSTMLDIMWVVQIVVPMWKKWLQIIKQGRKSLKETERHCVDGWWLFFLAGSRCSYKTETATWWFGSRRWCKVIEVSLHSHQSRNDRWGKLQKMIVSSWLTSSSYFKSIFKSILKLMKSCGLKCLFKFGL